MAASWVLDTKPALSTSLPAKQELAAVVDTMAPPGTAGDGQGLKGESEQVVGLKSMPPANDEDGQATY